MDVRLAKGGLRLVSLSSIFLSGAPEDVAALCSAKEKGFVLTSFCAKWHFITPPDWMILQRPSHTHSTHGRTGSGR